MKRSSHTVKHPTRNPTPTATRSQAPTSDDPPTTPRRKAVQPIRGDGPKRPLQKTGRTFQRRDLRVRKAPPQRVRIRCQLRRKATNNRVRTLHERHQIGVQRPSSPSMPLATRATCGSTSALIASPGPARRWLHARAFERIETARNRGSESFRAVPGHPPWPRFGQGTVRVARNRRSGLVSHPRAARDAVRLCAPDSRTVRGRTCSPRPVR